MKLRTSFAMLALTACMAFVLSSCTEETGPNGTTVPTGVQVNTLDASQITVRWTRDASDIGADTVIAVPSTGATVTAIALAGTSTATVSGLSLNQNYTIYVGSTAGRSSGITWATAARSTKLSIYETADNTPGHSSGLILGPVTQTASISGANSGQIDLVLATRHDNGMFMALQSASNDSSGIVGGRSTKVGDDYFFVAGGLINDYYNVDLAGMFSKGYSAFADFGAIQDTSVVLVVKTADNHYARVEIVPQAGAGGKLYKTIAVGSKQYYVIDVIVSYQTAINTPYAGRVEQIRRGTNEPISIGSRGVRK